MKNFRLRNVSNHRFFINKSFEAKPNIIPLTLPKASKPLMLIPEVSIKVRSAKIITIIFNILQRVPIGILALLASEFILLEYNSYSCISLNANNPSKNINIIFLPSKTECNISKFRNLFINATIYEAINTQIKTFKGILIEKTTIL